MVYCSRSESYWLANSSEHWLHLISLLHFQTRLFLPTQRSRCADNIANCTKEICCFVLFQLPILIRIVSRKKCCKCFVAIGHNVLVLVVSFSILINFKVMATANFEINVDQKYEMVVWQHEMEVWDTSMRSQYEMSIWDDSVRWQCEMSVWQHEMSVWQHEMSVWQYEMSV